MNLEPAHEKERSLSCFFCRELFPLYIEDKLDVARRNQIEKHVVTCASCRHILDRITFSQSILKELSKTHPTESLVNYIRKEQSFWTETFDKVGWRNWPSTLQWAVQLSLVAVILVTGIHFFPWLVVARRLHQIQKNAAPVVVSNPNQAPLDIEGGADTDKDGGTEPLQIPAKNSVAANTTPRAIDPQQFGPAIPEGMREDLKGLAPPAAPVAEKSVALAVSAPATTVDPGVYGPPAPPITIAEGTSVAMEPMREDIKPDAAKMAGFVWKGSLKVDTLNDDLTAKVVKIVTDMGGVKAGQVELGWHRGSERYFHFILPDDSYDRLQSALNREGIFALTKESHPRVIKQGHMRIIMTIEQNE